MSTGHMANHTSPTAVRLDWVGERDLAAGVREALIGPGAPFELVDDVVLGRPVRVFARRPASLPDVLAGAPADRPYLVFTEATLTYGEVASRAGAIAATLAAEHGVGPGDRVAVASANRLEYVLTYWAVLALGAVMVGLNGWWTGAELDYGVELSRPAVVLGDDERLARLAARSLAVPTRPLADLVEAAGRANGAGAGAGAGGLPAVEIAEDDPAVILFTSGTTGRPKGATLSHRNMVHVGQVNALTAAVRKAQLGVDPFLPTPGAHLVVGPLFHVSGINPLFGAPRLGNLVVFPPPGRWDERTHLELTARHGVQSWSAVPTNYWRLLQHPDLDTLDLSSLRAAASGGAVFPPALVRLFQEKLPQVSLSNGYGMTESFGLGTLANGPVVVEHPESVGDACPSAEVEVRGPDGTGLGEDEVGEIHLRHAGVFLGYWDDPEATAAAVDGDGWYRTGDFGRIAGGLLHMDSRMRDLIIRGGENIYPAEIENRLVEHPDIDDVAVIGVHHETLGHEVKAFVVPRSGVGLSAEDVRAWVAEALAAFKVPTHVEFRDSLPYTQNGKVKKHELEAGERA
jgi:acyl-CoA synthetase (AMP-forming)/AMP-acid ligase II